MSRAVVVGSGPNGLAAALTLAEAGLEVEVLERSDRPGGGTRSSELTLPGLIHDECSAAHPLALDTPFSRLARLDEHGLRWRWAQVEYSHPLDGGGGLAVRQSIDETAAGLPAPDGRRWRGLYGPLAKGFDALAEDVLKPVLHVPRHPIRLTRFGLPSALPAAVLAGRFADPDTRALFAGVAAHAFRPFSSPMSSAVAVMLGTAAHRFGWPVAEGGSRSISDAMIAALQARGGTVTCGVDVTSLGELGDADVVLLDTAPEAAARICGDRLPRRTARAYRRFRHGPGAFKVEFAVEGGVPWTHEDSRLAGTVHVGGAYEEIAAAEKATCSGRMPERPFVLVCQQSLADPSRANGAVHPLYAYAHVPSGWPGDATAAIEAQIERFAPGFRDRILARHVRSAPDMEAYNPNYVGGDIVTGANDALQLLFRPTPGLNPYATGIDGVYLCSAATPPGAGAHGLCGYNAAQVALKAL